MEGDIELRQWDGLMPDVLGLIFKNLSLEDTLTLVPRVCKSWERAVLGPYCWQDIDIEEWSQNCSSETVDRMLCMLVTRSSGSLRKLCVTGLRNDHSFAFIAENAKHLETLRLPRSEISNSMVEQFAGRFSSITFLDLSYCMKIGAPALDAIGNHCKSLSGLRRTMHPLEVIEKDSQDDEAIAIASTMPKLKHLEMAYLSVNTGPVIKIIENCSELELLDVRGCWAVKLDEKFLNKFPLLKIVGPSVANCCLMRAWDNCSIYSDSSGYVSSGYDDFEDDDHDMEDIEMRFYNEYDFYHDAFDWPLSP